MQNFQKQNELLEAKYFQVEELEERLENCWRGEEWVDMGAYNSSGDWVSDYQKVPCGTVNPRNDMY
jgi:hypothetical protein